MNENRNELLWTICDILSENVGESAIFKNHRNRRFYQIAYRNKLYGSKKSSSHTGFIPLILPNYLGVVGRCAKYIKMQVVNDTTIDRDYIVDSQFNHSECSIPITHNGSVEYIVDVEHQDKNFFTAENIGLIQHCADILQFSLYGKTNSNSLFNDVDWDTFILLGDMARKNTFDRFGRDYFLNLWKQKLGVNFIS